MAYPRKTFKNQLGTGAMTAIVLLRHKQRSKVIPTRKEKYFYDNSFFFFFRFNLVRSLYLYFELFLHVRVVRSLRTTIWVVFIGFGFSAHFIVHLLCHPVKVFLKTVLLIRTMSRNSGEV